MGIFFFQNFLISLHKLGGLIDKRVNKYLKVKILETINILGEDNKTRNGKTF